MDFPFSQRMMSIFDINNPYYTGSLAPNCNYWVHCHCLMLNITTHTQFLQRELMNCGYNCLPKIPSNSLIKEGEPSILILLKFLQQTSLYHLTILNYMSGLLTTNLQNVGTVRIFVNVQSSKLLSKKPYTNHHMMFNKSSFCDEDDGQKLQIWGCVLSHRTGNVLKYFHIHSFAVFYTNKWNCTIVTCILTSRVHILSNMQDRVLQLM